MAADQMSDSFIHRSLAHARRLADAVSPDALERNTIIGVFLVAAVPAVAGSLVSLLVNAFLVWAVISVVRGAFPLSLTDGDRLLVWAFVVHAASVLATGLLAPRTVGLVESSVWLVPYLIASGQFARLRARPRADLIQVFCLGASVGAIAAGIVGSVQMLAGAWRPEALAGNASIFGVMSLLLATIGALNVTSPSRSLRVLAVSGLALGLLATLLAQTRGVWIAAIPALAIVLAHSPRFWLRPSFGTIAGWLVALAAVCILVLWGEFLLTRIAYTQAEVVGLGEDGEIRSVGARLELWWAALPAILESPFIGYGIQNRMLAIQPFFLTLGSGVSGFTHAHNFIVTALLDGGLLVLSAQCAMLAAPLVIAWRARHDMLGRKRLALASLLVTIYVVNGFTQITFKHDIMDSFFIFASILVASSVPANSPDRQPDALKD